MKKLIQSFDWVVELLLTAVVIVTVTAGLMQVTAGAVYASESTAEEVPDREYLKAENLPADTDYVLVMDKSGSVWSQVYNGEAGVFEKIRNSAAQGCFPPRATAHNKYTGPRPVFQVLTRNRNLQRFRKTRGICHSFALSYGH